MAPTGTFVLTDVSFATMTGDPGSSGFFVS